MASISNTHDTYLAAFNAMVPNPGKRFITPAEELMFLNQAAITVAAKLGGLKYYVDLAITGSEEYVLDTHLFKVLSPAYIVENAGTTDESITHIDVLPFPNYIALKNNNQLPTGNYAFFSAPESNRLRFEPAPEVPTAPTTRIVRLVVWGMPQELTSGAVLYDGDVSQVNAVALEAVSLARIRSRDMQESAILHQRASEAVEDAARIKAITNRINRIRIGQDVPLRNTRRV